MFEFEVTPDVLITVLAIALSLVFEYVPKVKSWYDTLTEQGKKQIMLAGLVIISGAVYAGQCYGLFSTNLTCDLRSLVTLIGYIGLAIGVNQGTHLLTKK